MPRYRDTVACVRVFNLLAATLLAVALLGAGCARKATVTPAAPGTSLPAAPAAGRSGVIKDAREPSDALRRPAFRDVADKAGLNYRWRIVGTRPFNILQSIGNGCAFLDFDGNGKLDILLVGQPPALFRGNGQGRFTAVAQAAGLEHLSGHFLGCAVGDYDNDGYDDVYLSGYRTGVLLHNEAGKRFQDVTATAGLKLQPWGTSCAFADVDDDGLLDLYVANYVVFGPATKPQYCDTHGVRAACGPTSYQPERGVLYRNRGHGHFEDATRAWDGHTVSGRALGVAFADFDGTGRESLAIANDETPGDLLHNHSGKFANVGQPSGTAFAADGSVHGGMGIDWGDYNNDGHLDLFVATFFNQAKSLYRNEGDGTFTEQSTRLGLGPAASYVTFGTKFLDFDNDGWLDLILANGQVFDNAEQVYAIWGNLRGWNIGGKYRQSAQLFHNESGKRFVDASTLLEKTAHRPIVGRGLAVGDYDDDGRLDALVVDSEGKPLLLHNETELAGNWLSLRLIGTRSNRDGLGALVTVRAGALTQVRRCGTDGSYLSASDKRVHVGLGTATTASVSVRWPSGRTRTYQSLSANHFAILHEA